MATGTGAFIGVGVESSGAAGGATTWSSAAVDVLFFTSENLQVTRADVDPDNLMGIWDRSRVYNGAQRVEGDIACEVHPTLFGYMLRCAFDVCTAVTSSTYVASHANARDHRFVAGQTQFQTGSGSDLPTLTFEVFRGPAIGVGTSFLYYNCAATAFELSLEAGGLLKSTISVLGRDYGVKPRSTLTQEAAEAFLWSGASVSLDGTGTAIFESLTVRMDNQLAAVSKLDGRLRPDTIKRDGFRTVTVNGRVGFERLTDYDAFVGGSESALKLVVLGKSGITAAPANTEMVVVDIPKFRYSTFPLQTQGPGRLTIDFTGRGVYHPGSGTPLQIDLVNTRVSLYSVNTDG